jgi:hypothetical protein
MRKLPRNTSREALRSMLLFAKDLLSNEAVVPIGEKGYEKDGFIDEGACDAFGLYTPHNSHSLLRKRL